MKQIQRICRYRPVFNRRCKNLPKGEKALIQVEIRFPDNKKKYISTGIYVTRDQWDKRNGEVVGTLLSIQYNRRIKKMISDLQEAEYQQVNNGKLFSREMLNSPTAQSFYQFADKFRKERNDIGFETSKHHKVVIDRAKFQGVEMFSDLTIANINSLDIALRSEGKTQGTIYNYHKILKKYIKLAIDYGYFAADHNPYTNFKVKRGKAEIRFRLDDKQIKLIESVKLEAPDMDVSRDLFLFSMYTGVSYEDLRKLTFDNLRYINDSYWIEGLRKKSDEYYSIPIIPKAMQLIEKYSGNDKLFPCTTLQNQNRTLKAIGLMLNFKRPLTTHVARHTCASFMLRNGIPLNVISSILGHSDIRTTEIYAKLEKEIIKSELTKAKLL